LCWTFFSLTQFDSDCNLFFFFWQVSGECRSQLGFCLLIPPMELEGAVESLFNAGCFTDQGA